MPLDIWKNSLCLAGMNPLRLFLLTFGLLAVGTLSAADHPWNLDTLFQAPDYGWLPEGEDKAVRSLIYSGEPIDGQPTEVFAFYASPLTIGEAKAEDGPFPAVVLIHGGGGTAFAEWVHLWAKRGYAAIAMDLSGSRPPAPVFDEQGQFVSHDMGKEKRTKLEKGGLDHGAGQKFESIGGSIDDDWPYHAVASVIRAHSLIRSRPEVDLERTAVTGISWGGYTTCLVASTDDRFKAAVPVYGCGFLADGDSVQRKMIDGLGDRRQAWIDTWDPSSHLGRCTIPTLWVNGTNDVHYPLDSYAKSYGLVKGPRFIRIEPRMRHGHQPGWAPIEIGLFIDSYCKGGEPLPKVSEPTLADDGTVTVSVESPVPVTAATLQYTTDEGLRADRKWQAIEATVSGSTITAGPLPADANTWFVFLTDERGAKVSSDVRFR